MKTQLKLFVLERGDVGSVSDIQMHVNITVAKPKVIKDTDNKSVAGVVGIAIGEMITRELEQKLGEMG